MKKIEVLGPGCSNCTKTYDEVLKAAESIGLVRDKDFILGKVVDFTEIAKRGILATPGVIIDGKIVSTGRVPKRDDIVNWLH
jgi:small redox-active disulfide protein 2